MNFGQRRKLNTKLDITDALSIPDHLSPLYYNRSRNAQTHLCEDYISAFEFFTNKNLQSLHSKSYVSDEAWVCFSLTAGFFDKVQETESRTRKE